MQRQRAVTSWAFVYHEQPTRPLSTAMARIWPRSRCRDDTGSKTPRRGPTNSPAPSSSCSDSVSSTSVRSVRFPRQSLMASRPEFIVLLRHPRHWVTPVAIPRSNPSVTRFLCVTAQIRTASSLFQAPSVDRPAASRWVTLRHCATPLAQLMKRRLEQPLRLPFRVRSTPRRQLSIREDDRHRRPILSQAHALSN